MRQAALYLPWALLQRDDFNIAIDARKAYDDFNAHIQDLAAAADAAGAGDGSAQRVQQAFILMSASLDGCVAQSLYHVRCTVPICMFSQLPCLARVALQCPEHTE